MGLVRERIKRGGERLWRLADFDGLPFSAVAQALSRLTRSEQIERISKGLYFHGRKSAFGKSRPTPLSLEKIVLERNVIFPSGIAAANLLGFTTQAAGRREIATTAASLPRSLVGHDTVIHARRPAAWATLMEADAALLDFLRRRGELSELSSEVTIAKTIALLSKNKRYERIIEVADFEPPRVRALLGALGERIKTSPRALRQLRRSLNPFSQFDFGLFVDLPNARQWQAKRHT